MRQFPAKHPLRHLRQAPVIVGKPATINEPKHIDRAKNPDNNQDCPPEVMESVGVAVVSFCHELVRLGVMKKADASVVVGIVFETE